MKILAILSRKRNRPRRPGPSALLSPAPGFEPLEGRALMALISSVAFDPLGQEVATVVVNWPGGETGGLHMVTADNYIGNGPQPYSNYSSTPLLALRSASTAYDKGGNILQDFVDTQGVATQYISYTNGLYAQTALGPGVESMSVAFEPDGTGVSDVVYEDGSYYEFTSSGGSTLVASNVVSASVAIDSQGNKLQDYVTADEVAHEISGGTTTTLGTNVVSDGVGFDGNGGVVRAVVFSNGTAYQYDYAGAHASPSLVFTPILQHLGGSTSIAFNPSSGEEYALVTYPYPAPYLANIGATYLFTPTSGGVSSVENLGSSIAFGLNGKLVRDDVDGFGRVLQYINGAFDSQVGMDGSTFLGSHVQSMSIAFDPQGKEVADVVHFEGDYDEVDSSGNSTLIASNVVSASVAIDRNGNKLQDYVTDDGVAHEISDGTTTTLGTNVVSISVAYDGNGGIVRSVLFTDGNAYQYDYAGQHLQGQVFNPFLINRNRLSFKANLPSY